MNPLKEEQERPELLHGSWGKLPDTFMKSKHQHHPVETREGPGTPNPLPERSGRTFQIQENIPDSEHS